MKPLAGLLLVACASQPPIPAVGPCSVAARAEIGAAYLSELQACGSPCAEFDAITARRDARRKIWLECSQQ